MAESQSNLTLTLCQLSHSIDYVNCLEHQSSGDDAHESTGGHVANRTAGGGRRLGCSRGGGSSRGGGGDLLLDRGGGLDGIDLISDLLVRLSLGDATVDLVSDALGLIGEGEAVRARDLVGRVAVHAYVHDLIVKSKVDAGGVAVARLVEHARRAHVVPAPESIARDVVVVGTEIDDLVQDAEVVGLRPEGDRALGVGTRGQVELDEEPVADGREGEHAVLDVRSLGARV